MYFSISRDQPVFLAYVLVTLMSIFKSYPSYADVAIFITLLPMWRHLFTCKYRLSMYLLLSFDAKCFIYNIASVDFFFIHICSLAQNHALLNQLGGIEVSWKHIILLENEIVSSCKIKGISCKSLLLIKFYQTLLVTFVKVVKAQLRILSPELFLTRPCVDTHWSNIKCIIYKFAEIRIPQNSLPMLQSVSSNNRNCL